MAQLGLESVPYSTGRDLQAHRPVSANKHALQEYKTTIGNEYNSRVRLLYSCTLDVAGLSPRPPRRPQTQRSPPPSLPLSLSSSSKSQLKVGEREISEGGEGEGAGGGGGVGGGGARSAIIESRPLRVRRAKRGGEGKRLRGGWKETGAVESGGSPPVERESGRRAGAAKRSGAQAEEGGS